MQLRVFESLSAKDLIRASGTCREWRDIASHDVLWRRALRHSCHHLLVPPAELHGESHKSQYFVNEGWRKGAFLRRKTPHASPSPIVKVAFTRGGASLAAVNTDGQVTFIDPAQADANSTHTIAAEERTCAASEHQTTAPPPPPPVTCAVFLDPSAPSAAVCGDESGRLLMTDPTPRPTGAGCRLATSSRRVL